MSDSNPRSRAIMPGKDCFVTHRDKECHVGELGVVVDADSDRLSVRWGQHGKEEWHHPDELRNGFRLGHIVQDRPRSNIRKTLGTGTVIAYRRIANREMVLV